MKKIQFLVLLITILVVPVTSYGTDHYLGHLGGGFTKVYAMNKSGVVVGYSYDSKGWPHAFVIIPRDTDLNGQPDTWFIDLGRGVNKLMVDLGVMFNGTTLDDMSTAVDINDEGVIIGQGEYTSFILYPKDDGSGRTIYVDIGSNGENQFMKPLGKDVWAYAINNLNQVVGYIGTFLKASPFLWDGILNKIPVLPESTAGYALNINDHGDIVGTCQINGQNYAGAVWLGSIMKVFPITDPRYEQSIVWDINNHLQITGIFAQKNIQDGNPFTLTPLDDNGDGIFETWMSGEFHNDLIQIISPGYNGEAYRVTDRGQIVGWLELDEPDPAGDNRQAFLWSEQDGLVSVGGVSCLSKQMYEWALRTTYNTCSVGMDVIDGGSHALVAMNADFKSVYYPGTFNKAGYIWDVPIIPPTPQQQIDIIEDQIGDIIANPDSNLNENDAKALNTTLDASGDNFAKGNTNAGCNVLKAFKNQIAAKVKSGKLTPEEGQALVDAADNVPECQ